jgi:prepilin-type N-terminal cleavage/methylation domain-containing protein
VIIDELRLPTSGLAFAWLNDVFRLRSLDRPFGRHTRGFTLVELMVVVVIITALSALAIPSILKQMRDRRTRQAAEEIAAIYRQARLRALGRGSAVLVRYFFDGANSSFTTLEAVLGGPAGTCTQQLPASSCTLTLWDRDQTNLSGAQTVATWSPLLGITSQVFADYTTNGSGKTTDTALTSLDICFTPMGRALFRTPSADGTQFKAMSGVPVMLVSRGDEGLKRYVVIPPNGLSRTDVATP